MTLGTKRYHHGDLERALIDAGFDLLAEGGISAVGVRAAARRVGVSHAAPAHHFPDATSFLAALAAEAYLQMESALIAASQTEGDALERFRQVGFGYVHHAVANPERFRLQFHPQLADKRPYPRLLDASTRAFEQLRIAVEAALDAGSLRDDASVADLALTAWASVHGIATLLVDQQLAAKGYELNPDQATDLILSRLFVGMAPGPVGARSSDMVAEQGESPPPHA